MFTTRFNGAQPYAVRIGESTVTITPNEPAEEDQGEEQRRTTVIHHPHAVFVGKSPANTMTVASGAHGPRFDGNTVLVGVSPLEYLYVCEDLTRFKTHAPIVAYSSPVGNSDVPYAYAVDELGHVYLMAEGVVMPLGGSSVDASLDPYQRFYRLTRGDRRRQRQHIPLDMVVRDSQTGEALHEFYDVYTPTPLAMMRRLTDNGQHTLEIAGRTMTAVSVVEHYRTMGQRLGVEPFQQIVAIASGSEGSRPCL